MNCTSLTFVEFCAVVFNFFTPCLLAPSMFLVRQTWLINGVLKRWEVCWIHILTYELHIVDHCWIYPAVFDFFSTFFALCLCTFDTSTTTSSTHWLRPEVISGTCMANLITLILHYWPFLTVSSSANIFIPLSSLGTCTTSISTS